MKGMALTYPVGNTDHLQEQTTTQQKLALLQLNRLETSTWGLLPAYQQQGGKNNLGFLVRLTQTS